jgi:hypothetical protein
MAAKRPCAAPDRSFGRSVALSLESGLPFRESGIPSGREEGEMSFAIDRRDFGQGTLVSLR